MIEAVLIAIIAFFGVVVVCMWWEKITTLRYQFLLDRKKVRETSEIETHIKALSEELKECRSKVDSLSLRVGLGIKK